MCEGLAIDTQRPKVSLVGVFHSLHFKEFPARPERFTVYAVLYDGVGEGKMELVITRQETEEDVNTYSKWVGFPGRGRIAHVEISLQKCSFPAPGRYRIMLRFDGNILTERLMDVFEG
jgi:hypothetical protein